MNYSEKFVQVMFFYFIITYFLPVILAAFNVVKNQMQWGNVSAAMSILSGVLWFSVGHKYV